MFIFFAVVIVTLATVFVLFASDERPDARRKQVEPTTDAVMPGAIRV